MIHKITVCSDDTSGENSGGKQTSVYYMDSEESAILLFKTWYAEKGEKITKCHDLEKGELILDSEQAHAVVVPFPEFYKENV